MEITVRKPDLVNEVLLTQGVVERKTTSYTVKTIQLLL